MRRSTIAIVLLQLMLSAAAPTAAAGGAQAIDGLSGADKLHALMGAVVEAQRDARSLQADFRLVKESDLLLEPVVSRGTFTYLAPGQVRWDYSQPEAMVVVFGGDVLTTYYPQQQRAEQVEMTRKHERFLRVLAGTQPLDELAQQFRVTLQDPGAPAPYRLLLEPIHRTLRRRLEQVVLEVDRRLLLPVTVEYAQPDGDRTRYEFANLRVNPPVEATRFLLELGPSVRVERIAVPSSP